MLDCQRIIFWQPTDSPHQEAFLEAVAKEFPGEVFLGVERTLPAKRVAQGWRIPGHERVRVLNVSEPAHHASLVSHSGPDSLHVFSGFFSHPRVWSAFHKLKCSNARLAIYSEAPEQPWHTGLLKRLRGRWLAARHAKRFEFVLAIGRIGCDFFEMIGFPKEKIVPFGYYLAVPPLTATDSSTPPHGLFRFISAGQLIPRKGIDILIRACASLPPAGWHLDIYGDGPERGRLEQLAARLGLADRLTFHGIAPNATLLQAIAAADCAVLPSRFDGWGTLVNEALAAGTPAICTNRCGSAALIEASDSAGQITAAGARPLAEALARALAAGSPSSGRRRVVHEVALAVASPAFAAQRFLASATAPASALLFSA